MDQFWIIFTLEGVVVLKGLILDYWLIWHCQITTDGIADCYLSVYVSAPSGSHTGQSFWLNWSVANSAHTIRLHCHHCQTRHHCLLCTALLIVWLMPVNS